MSIPVAITQGDTTEWVQSSGDYPADVWTLTYTMINLATKETIVATDDGNGDFAVKLDAAVTALYIPGDYKWSAKVTDGVAVHTVGYGCTKVIADPSVLNSYDGRSWAEISLEAVEAVIANRATLDQESYSIAGRSLSRTPMQDLINLRKYLQSEVAAQACSSNNPGGVSNKKAVVRF